MKLSENYVKYRIYYSRPCCTESKKLGVCKIFLIRCSTWKSFFEYSATNNHNQRSLKTPTHFCLLMIWYLSQKLPIVLESNLISKYLKAGIVRAKKIAKNGFLKRHGSKESFQRNKENVQPAEFMMNLGVSVKRGLSWIYLFDEKPKKVNCPAQHVAKLNFLLSFQRWLSHFF